MVWYAHPINKIKNQPHRNTKLLKIQFPIAIDIGQIPHPFELLITQPTVAENACRLRVVEARLSVGQRREDFPVSLNFPSLDFLGHSSFVPWLCGRVLN
jgi:hypothetical protein